MNVVFDKNWFNQHQSKLIWLLNNRFTKRWFRWVLCIDNREIINRIEPNAYWFGAKKKGKKIEVTADFRTHDKYSKRLYFAFSPLWWTMHFLDWLFIDRYVPKLSFGFLTLTVYPDAGTPGTTSIDGSIEKTSAATWALARDATDGSSTNQTLANTYVVKSSKNSAVDWTVRRAFHLFDTSALTSSATISASVFSLAASGWGTTENADSFTIRIVSSTPASDTALANADFDQVGTTVFASLLYSSWTDTASTYNDFTLDANGIANVSKTGISKFATRTSLDVSNTAPTGVNGFGCYFADQAGTSTDPKLVVTYTVVVPVTSNFLMFFGPQPQQ